MEEAPQIRLIAGLGNPGSEYATTRHNIGFMIVDKLAAQFGSTWERSTKWDANWAKCGPVLLVKPMSFMNRSGYPLFGIAQFYKIEPQEFLVVLDDLALPLGRLRLRARGGFEVDIDWRERKLTRSTVRSINGTDCKVRYGNRVVTVRLARGAAARLNVKLQRIS